MKLISEFRDIIKKLERNLPGLSENINKIVLLIDIDQEMAMARARICCEIIAKDIFQKNRGLLQQNTPTFDTRNEKLYS